MLPKKQGVFLRICGIFYPLLFLGGIFFPFIWSPIPYIPKISLGVAALFWLIGMIKGASVKAQKEAEAKAKAAEAEAATLEAEEAKAVERYNAVMPKVKRYLDSVGFELPPDENVFFMQIDEDTGKWKYEVTFDLHLEEWVKNEDWEANSQCDILCYKCKYKLEKCTEKSPSANGILLSSDGKAYIGAIQGNQTFWWHTEDGVGIDNNLQPSIHNVVAVGNISKQLLCGLHLKIADRDKLSDNEFDEDTDDYFTNKPEEKKKDYYWSSTFPKSVKRIFILPSDEYEKKNTVTLGGAFRDCSNLRLFYMGFDKCEHEKFFCKIIHTKYLQMIPMQNL